MAEGPTVAAAKLEDEITCPLCLDVFNEPKMLPCYHVYCRAPCLEGLALRGRGTITCPECRNVTQVPGNDVNNVPTAFHINRLKELHQTATPIPAPTQAFSPSYNCQKHQSQSLDLYCKTCQTLVCRDCILADHKHTGHEYGYVAQIAPSYRDSTLEMLAPSKLLTEQLSTAANVTAQMKDQLEKQKTALANEVNASFDALADVLQEHRQNSLRTMEQLMNGKIHAITVHEQDVKSAHKQLKALIDSVESTLKNETNPELLFVSQKSRMKVIAEITEKVNHLALIPEEIPSVGVQTPTPDELHHLCLQTSTVYFLADPSKCTAEGDGLQGGETGKTSAFTVHLVDSRGNPCIGRHNVMTELKTVRPGSVMEDSTISVQAIAISSSRYEVCYHPRTRGRHQLSVKVNSAHIAGSPFRVFIHHPSTKLREPVATITAPDVGGLLHTNGKLLIGSYSGTAISIIQGNFTFGQHRLNGPHKLAIDHHSKIYITTCQDHKLHKYTKEGVHLKSVGGKGEKPGSFNFPNGIRVSKDNKVYVCDSGNHRIQVFDTDLDLLHVIGGKGSKKVKFNFPTTLDFDDRGDMYVADCSNHQIQVLTPEGKFLRSFSKKGRNPGMLKAPISINITGKIAYITEFDNNCVSVFDLCGQLTTTFGEGHLLGPDGIAIDEDGFVYVSHNRTAVLVF